MRKTRPKNPPANSRISHSVAVPQPNPSNREFAAIAFAWQVRPTRGHTRSANCSVGLCTVQKKRKVHWSAQACKSRKNNRRMRCQPNAPFGRRRFSFHGESVESARPDLHLDRQLKDPHWDWPQVVVVWAARACRHQIQDSTVHQHYEEAQIEKYSLCVHLIVVTVQTSSQFRKCLANDFDKVLHVRHRFIEKFFLCGIEFDVNNALHAVAAQDTWNADKVTAALVARSNAEVIFAVRRAWQNSLLVLNDRLDHLNRS